MLRGFEERMDFLSLEKGSVITPREVVRASLSEKEVTEQALALDDVAIITFTRRDLLILVEETGARRVKAWSGRNDRLYRGTAGGEGCILTQSRYGAPNAVILLEELVAFGVKKAVFLGYCGSIQGHIGVGEVMLPTYSIREEGTSYHYFPKGMSCHADQRIQSFIHNGLLECGIEPYVGMCWTTDALYRETEEKIRRYRSKGVLAVDMETSAIFCLGIYRNIRVGSAMVVTDEFSESSWEGSFSSEKVRAVMRMVCQTIVQRIGNLWSL
ncbi:MAG: nucleoside phosphorylase [Syntrophobacterales bacterium]|nr:MAG: nucleoside phosphorylase [Syntrophobacterales bacterium]